MKNKIVLYKGDLETTAFFLEQMATGFIECGAEVLEFQFDVTAAKEGKKQRIKQLIDFWQKDYTIVVSFNFAGIYGEDALTVSNIEEKEELCSAIGLSKEAFDSLDGEMLIFDLLALPYYNIVVDHPYHYHMHLNKRTKAYHQICIDRNHIAYMKRYFPQIDVLPFMPSAGTAIGQTYPELAGRKYDVIMTGSYIPPEAFYLFMDRNGEEYGAFYRSMLKETLTEPSRLLEDVVRRRLVEEIPQVTEEEICETLGHIQFLDYYIRFYVRRMVVKELVDHDIIVYVFGGGWEKFTCDKPQNLFFEAESGGMVSLKEAQQNELSSRYLTSRECLERIRDARISLNVMPWFKDGSHDRIYNSMLNGAVVVTDGSIYLNETLQDSDLVCFYDLKHVERLPEMIRNLLQDKKTMERMARSAYEYAAKEHTWSDRARQLVGYLGES